MGKIKDWIAELFESPKSFQEDYELENGQYTNSCIKCSSKFIGYKRRVICKECGQKEAPPEKCKMEYLGNLYITFCTRCNSSTKACNR
jgi:hypothetical protein